MTDPFLLSSSDGESVPPARPVGRMDELARRAGVPRGVLDIVSPEVIEDFVTRVESWADLSAGLRQALGAAGFQQHDPRGAEGGFYIASHLRDDGVLATWSTRDYTSHEPGSFENMIPAIMNPALQSVLAVCGVAVQTIPAGEDNAGDLLVTGRTDMPA